MKEQNTPELDLSPIFDATSNLHEVFSVAFHILLITAVAFFAIRIAIALIRAFQYRMSDRGNRVEYQPKPKPEEPVTRTNGGYFVKTPGGERVFVSDAEIYPNDPDVADRSRVRGKWSSNARRESIPDRSNDLVTGLIIGSAVSSAIESSSNSHSHHSSGHSDHSSSHNSYDSHSSQHSYTDHSSGFYGGDSGGGSGGMDF